MGRRTASTLQLIVLVQSKLAYFEHFLLHRQRRVETLRGLSEVAESLREDLGEVVDVCRADKMGLVTLGLEQPLRRVRAMRWLKDLRIVLPLSVVIS